MLTRKIKVYVMITFLLVILGVGCSMSNNKNEYLDDKFKAGQVWNYTTRKGEEKSTVKVLKVEKDDKQGIIVHIAVDNLNIIDADGIVHQDIGHLPFSRAALEKSVTKLVAENEKLPDYKDGYNKWKEAFDKGQAGIWTVSVSEAVKAMDEVMKKK